MSPTQLFVLVLLLLQGAGVGAQVGIPEIELDDCRLTAGPGFPSIAARCGTLTRPENPAAPAGDQIDLFVAVVPALSLKPEPDPVTVLAGGPGQGATEFYAAYAPAFEELRRERDIVLMDQRGTGRSHSLDCPISDQVLDGLGPLENLAEQVRLCLADLDGDPRFYTSSIAVQDLEALRIALGYPQFNVYGISYGTRVAQHLLRRHPDSVRSVILDGVVPPTMALGPEIAVKAQKALDQMFERCATDPYCGERFPLLHESFAKLQAELRAQPAEVRLAHPTSGEVATHYLDDNALAGVIRLLLYHPDTVALLPLLIDQAAREDYLVPLLAQYLLTTEKIGRTLSFGMHNSVVCTEDAPFFANEGVSDDALTATFIGPAQLQTLTDICAIWPKGVMDDDFKQALAADVPVLLLSGDADPITPPEYAERAGLKLGNKISLVGIRQGHGQALLGCMPKILRRFVDAGDLEADDIECMGRQQVMPFFLDFSGPAQ